MVYAAYNNPFNVLNAPNNYNPSWLQEFDPGYFKNASNQTTKCGQSDTTNFASGNSTYFGNLPSAGSGQIDLETIAVIFQGYFVVPATGSYLFQTTSDDFGYIWVGQKALNQWNNNNYDGSVNTTSSPVLLNRGDNVPVTFLYANGGGFCASIFEITYPNGTQLNGNFATDFVQPNATDPWMPTPQTNCRTPSLYDKNNFRVFYAGSGFALDPTNPSNDNTSHPRIIKNYAQGAHYADVLQDCEAQANSYGYMTIDIHFSYSANRWVCTMYWFSNDLSKYYSTPDPDTTQSHGYLSGANGDVPYLDCTFDEPSGVKQFYEGFATVLDPTKFRPDCMFTLDDGYSYLDACQAVLACTSDATQWGYSTVEVYFQETESVWICVEYFAPYTQTSYFNVTNSTLGQVFGLDVR